MMTMGSIKLFQGIFSNFVLPHNRSIYCKWQLQLSTEHAMNDRTEHTMNDVTL